MINDSDVHYHSINLNPGDVVMVARSFDNNPTTKKIKFNRFYEMACGF